MSRNTIFSTIELVLSFIGASISGLLYWAHTSNVELPCSEGNACDLVWASHWSHLGNYPLSLIGFAGYGLLAILSVAKLNAEERSVRPIKIVMLLMALCATAFSWYLQYVSHVFIGVICPYCMTSAITMTILCITLIVETSNAKNEPTAMSAHA